MTKDDIKDYLIKRGASERLLKMPAVMERIYAYFDINPENRYSALSGSIIPVSILLPRELNMTIRIGVDGSITINNGKDRRVFEERPNGEAAYINNDMSNMSVDEVGEYLIDQYGMDKCYIDSDGKKLQRNADGTVHGYGIDYEDNGLAILNSAYYIEMKYTKQPEEEENIWEENREELTSYYPQTQEWFDIRDSQRKARNNEQAKDEEEASIQMDENDSEVVELRIENKELKGKKAELESIIDERDKTIEYLQDRDEENGRTITELKKSNEEKVETIKELQQENAEKDERIGDLQARNSNLQERNSNLQAMLSKALDKLQQVKSSIFGRFFFTKEERREAKKAKRLPEGDER